ncbi:class II aldolase/adducin family protein [uncultured Amnibacterium sp.]|uniref:class II aldolase/adducin family protein n=1 Tax=uncultured Amnibacterium sp. TaxID=1631851 RepID=UPI0035CB4DDF
MTATPTPTSTPVPTRAAALEDIVQLSRTIGRPEADLVILAEGNTSIRTPGDRMLVKATGAALRTADEDDFVEVDLNAYTALLAGGDVSDAQVAERLQAAVVVGTKRPSVESLLHAVCLALPGVQVAAHTHPTAVNAVLCSAHPELLVGSLFPDQIVVLGRRPLLIPYLDPGLTLARFVAARLPEHVERFGQPKVVYLANHGMFALGATADEVLRITQMAVKAAWVVAGAVALGGPSYLSAEHEERIDTRPDEEHRRRLLAAELVRPTEHDRYERDQQGLDQYEHDQQATP